MVREALYRVYVLVVRPAHSDSIPGWQISVENVTTGERGQFDTVQDAVRFLEEDLESLTHNLREVEGV